MARKLIESDIEKGIKEFNDYFQSTQERENKEIDDLYNHIREAYRIKFNNDEIKIKIEKMNIERNIGRYQGALRKNGLTLFIGILGIMIQLMLPEFLRMLNINNPAVNFIIMGIFIVWFISNIGKDFDKQRPRDLMNFVALKVLDDMENEIADQKAIDEKKVTWERIEQCVSKNNVLNNALTTFAEVAAEKVVREGIVRRVLSVFRKKKK